MPEIPSKRLQRRYSRKIKNELKVRELKRPIVNQQRVVHSRKCDLCHVDYADCTGSHSYQLIDELKRSVIRKHVCECQGEDTSIIEGFSVLRKCQRKV